MQQALGHSAPAPCVKRKGSRCAARAAGLAAAGAWRSPAESTALLPLWW